MGNPLQGLIKEFINVGANLSLRIALYNLWVQISKFLGIKGLSQITVGVGAPSAPTLNWPLFLLAVAIFTSLA